jgi:hypothetical protein
MNRSCTTDRLLRGKSTLLLQGFEILTTLPYAVVRIKLLYYLVVSTVFHVTKKGVADFHLLPFLACSDEAFLLDPHDKPFHFRQTLIRRVLVERLALVPSVCYY